jgi:hypothetical protein
LFWIVGFSIIEMTVKLDANIKTQIKPFW